MVLWLGFVFRGSRLFYAQVFDRFFNLSNTLLLILLFQSTSAAFAGVLPPVWTVPTWTASDDGYAVLDWVLADGESADFFKLTESHNGALSVHYTETAGLQAWRAAPGKYDFVLQACVKTLGGEPDCGNPSDTLTLEVSGEVATTLLAQGESGFSYSTANSGSNGGPDQLLPGHWFNPEKDGHGWSFYWSNRLDLPQNDPLFGDSYDLVGVWYTYEAKHAEADPGCPTCSPVTSEYRPVVLLLKAVSTGTDTFGGSLYVSRPDGTELWVGSADVAFTSDNSSATVNWNANFKKENLSDSDPLIFLLGSDPADSNNISHFSGLWKNSSDNRYYVVTNIGDSAEVIVIVFHDNAGDPTWLQGVNFSSAVATSTNFCLAYQYEGYSPQLDKPVGWSKDWRMSGCDADLPSDTSNRNGRRFFTSLDRQYLWAEFSLPDTGFSSGSVNIGSAATPVSLEKVASFHAVAYDSESGSSCELNTTTSACELQISWYTDGDYPDATVYAHNQSDNTYQKVLSSTRPVMLDIPYEVSVAGQYEFELHMGDSVQSTLMARSESFTVLDKVAEPDPEIPPEPAAPPTFTASISSSRIGSTAGAFQVAESGSATYSVPVLMAPASGGISPEISLNYNSQVGNGTVGVGWAIAGVSVISLCPQATELDSVSGSREIQLDGKDRFCLDGQRLVLDPSSGGYGEHGSRYRTEIDNFARITSYGSAGNGPAWFKLERRDGSVLEYGNSNQSRIEARGSDSPATVFLWAQNRFEDRSGNYILYNYDENSNGAVGYVLQSIDYAGNTRAGSMPSARLSFEYTERETASDLTYSYFAGVQLEQRKLLQSISSQGILQAGSPLEYLRFYHLGYEEDGLGRKILVELTECRSPDRIVCYPPTRFNWLKSESKIDTTEIVQDGLLPQSALSGLLFADVSGDGRPDLLYTKSKSRQHSLYIKEANSSADFREWPASYSLPKKSDGGAPRVFAIDINADGFQDIVYSKYDKSGSDYYWVTRLSNGSGLSSEIELNPGYRFFLNGEELESRIQVLDFNGDGLSDILHAQSNLSGDAWQLTALLNQSKAGDNPVLSAPIVIDADNSDLFPANIPGWEVEIHPPLFNGVEDNTYQRSAPAARVFDFNGDGAVDMLLKVWRRYQKCVSNCELLGAAGTGGENKRGGKNGDPIYHSENASFWVLMETSGDNSFRRQSIVALGEDCIIEVVCGVAEYAELPRSDNVWPVDINADGLADVAWGDADGNWYFQINNGNAFGTAKTIGAVGAGINKLARFEDWNGDVYPDLVYPSDTLDSNARWVVYQNFFGRTFSAAITTPVPAGNVGGYKGIDEVENDLSVFADFDGDGKGDQLFINNNKNAEILSTSIRKGRNVSGSSATEPANVITSVTSGFGAVTSISYKPLTDSSVYTRTLDSYSANWGNGAPVYDYIAPVFVVSEVSGNAPTFADPEARSHAEYHYVGAKLQAGGRGLLGFAEIIVYDPQLQVRTNTRYRQDFPFIGRPVETVSASHAAYSKFSPLTDVVSKSPPTWPAVDTATQPRSPISGTLLSYSYSSWQKASTVTGAWRVFADKSISRGYTLSGNFENKVFTQNGYDSFANLTSTIVKTYSEDVSTPFATRTTQNLWSSATTSDWRLGDLVASSVTHDRAGKPPVTRNSAFSYDAVTGLLMKETIEPGDPSLEIATNYSRDLFGNHTSVSIKGAGMASRTSFTTYDPHGRFVVAEINALGQEFRKINSGRWDVFGNPLEIQNIDGVVSTSVVDYMGRPFASFNETGTWQKTLNYSGSGRHCPSGTVRYKASDVGGGSSSSQCFDVNGRTIRSIGTGLNGQLIYVDQYYDISGRPSMVSEPYFSNAEAYWNESVYDVSGRITDVSSAGGDDISTLYDEQAAGDCVISGPRVSLTTDALGQRVTEVKNVLGETVESYDENCGLVTFDYNSMGQLVTVTGADGVTVSMSYDAAGRKISQSDPDKGTWRYAYNAVGELTRQLDAKQQAIDFEYDVMGRVSHRRELSGVDNLTDSAFQTVNHEVTTFRTASPGKSQVSSITYLDGESGEIVHKNSMNYDWLGRVAAVSTVVGGQQFYRQTTYDDYGRVFQEFDESGGNRGLRYVYRNGHLSQLKEARDGVNGVVYQDILETDARGNVIQAEFGNGVTAMAQFDAASGRLTSLSAFDQLDVELQDVHYLFDVLGNLKVRHERSGSSDLMEEFGYDDLNRLQQVKLTAPALGLPVAVQTLALDYDVSGNITWKSDVGSYSYGAGSAGPHALTQAGSARYSYDLNGNQLNGDGRTFVYSVFDKATTLTSGFSKTVFTYGIGNRRLKREDSDSGELGQTTVYLGNIEYIKQADGTTSFRRYIGGMAIATYFPATSVQQLSYLLKDHIGSIHSVLNEDGLITARMHFSPFGDRQGSDWQTTLDAYLYAPLSNITSRGFTGHEHVDKLGIIHMNGRIYDARLGRFLQADPFIQSAGNSQNLNRYSYVLNNPLSYTDPSGYFSLGRFIKKWGPTILAIAASVVLPGAGGVLAVHFGVNSAFAQVVITGFIAGGITGGVKGAVRGAFLAAVTYGVTEYFNHAAEGKIALDEGNLTPSRDSLEHMLGSNDPSAGLYKIEVQLDGSFDRARSISANGVRSGNTIFSNGVNNDFQAAVRNGTTQVAQLDGVATNYILNFNPTQTIGMDLLESARDITNTYFGFGQSELAENLAKVIDTASKNGVTGLRLIGHSQGAAITTSALRIAADRGLNMSAVASVNLHGAPINDLFAKKSLAKRIGIEGNSIIPRAQFGDPVHNILGGNFISNPLSLPFSAIRIPQVFSHDATLSPHTTPCFGGRLAIC